MSNDDALELPSDLHYDAASHLWVRRDPAPGRARVGVDAESAPLASSQPPKNIGTALLVNSTCPEPSTSMAARAWWKVAPTRLALSPGR